MSGRFCRIASGFELLAFDERKRRIIAVGARLMPVAETSLRIDKILDGDAQRGVRQVGVSRRDLDVGVAHQHLDRQQVDALHRELRGEGVPVIPRAG